MKTTAGYRVEYRTVGFTSSHYTSGGREIGWKGDFFPAFAEAAAAGCGDNGNASGEEVRLYVDRDFIASLDSEGSISDEWSEVEARVNNIYDDETAAEILKDLSEYC